MKRLIISFVLILILALVSIGYGPSPALSATGKKIELRMGYTLPPGAAPYNGWEWFAQELEKRTNGQVTLKLFPGGTLARARGMKDAIVSGMSTFGFIVNVGHAKDWPLTHAIMLPTLGFPNNLEGMIAAGKALFTVYTEFPEIQAEHANPKLKVISAMTTGPYMYQGKKAVHVPADLKGLKIASFSPMSELVKGGSGTPVSVPLPRVYMNLQTGVINGSLTSWSSVQTFKFWEVVKNFTDYDLGRIFNMICVNTDTWNSLSKEHQDLILELIPQANRKGAELMSSNEGKAKANALANGAIVRKPAGAERAKWDALGQSIEKKWVTDMNAKGFNAQKIVDRLKALASQASK